MSLLTLGAISVAGYRSRTGDTTTGSADVEVALEDAEDRVAHALRRVVAGQSALAAGNYSARLRIHPDGRIYPPAYPVTGSTVLTLESSRVLLGATPDGGPWIAFSADGGSRPYATVSWAGGYTTSTLPPALRDAIYDLSEAIATSQTPALVAAGASSVSLGDASVSFGSGGVVFGDLDTLVPGLTSRLGRYVNRLGDGMG